MISSPLIVSKFKFFKIMDKRSFNFMFTMVIASMVVIGTYKIAKKKNTPVVKNTSSVSKNKK